MRQYNCIKHVITHLLKIALNVSMEPTILGYEIETTILETSTKHKQIATQIKKDTVL